MMPMAHSCETLHSCRVVTSRHDRGQLQLRSGWRHLHLNLAERKLTLLMGYLGHTESGDREEMVSQGLNPSYALRISYVDQGTAFGAMLIQSIDPFGLFVMSLNEMRTPLITIPGPHLGSSSFPLKVTAFRSMFLLKESASLIAGVRASSVSVALRPF